jgi:hypothetical protein
MPSTEDAVTLSRAAARNESALIPSFSAASVETSGIVSPSGTVKRSAAFLPVASIVRTFHGDVPAGNSYTPA